MNRNFRVDRVERRNCRLFSEQFVVIKRLVCVLEESVCFHLKCEIFFLGRYSPTRARAASFLRFLDDAQ
jgi:hypothetical protein